MKTLVEVQNGALAALSNNPQGHIDVHVRQRMWAELGPVSDEDSLEAGADALPGHLARAWLMCECVRLALPEWELEKNRAASEILLDPRDEPTSAVSYIDEWLAGTLPRSELLRHANRYQDLSFYLFELHESYPNAELIANAACNALWVAAWDQASDYEDEYREEDNEVFPADFMIAWLKSGGAPWDSDQVTANRRREFWEWYIVDAFARAWEIAYPKG
jgi:hypothetical protein